MGQSYGTAAASSQSSHVGRHDRLSVITEMFRLGDASDTPTSRL